MDRGMMVVQPKAGLRQMLIGVAPAGALLGSMLSFTLGASLAKHIFPLVGASGSTTLRLAIAAIILLPLYRPWRVQWTRHNWRPVIFYGLSMGAMNLLFYMALRTVPLGIAIALEFTGPLAVAILASRRKTDFLWISLASAGLLMLLPLRGNAAAIDPLGAACALGAGLFWALYIHTGKRAGRDHGAMATSLGMTVAGLAVLPVGIIEAGPTLLQPFVLGIGVLVAILSSALPYSLEMFALRRLPAQTYGTLVSGEPAVGAVVGLLLLGEALPVLQWIGIGLIVLASVGTTISAMRLARRPQALAVDTPLPTQ